MQATEAENIRRAQEVSKVQRAEQARQEAQIAEAQIAAAKTVPVRIAEPEPESASPVIRALRAAAAEGEVGRLGASTGSPQSALDARRAWMLRAPRTGGDRRRARCRSGRSGQARHHGADPRRP